MPVGYGGGVASAREARRITGIGIEKVVLNTVVVERPEVVTEISEALGASSTVVSVDAKKRLTGGWDTFVRRGTRRTGLSPVALATRAAELGSGEILVSSIDRESTFTGYDLPLIESISAAVDLPVIALGGASEIGDFARALAVGAAAGAASSMFVLNGRHRAVLISYPTPAQIRALGAA